MVTKTKNATVNPFQVKQTSAKASKNDVLTVPPAIAEAVDEFNGLNRQIKNLTSLQAASKATVTEYCQQEFASRKLTGVEGNFKVQGGEATATYICQDRSSGISGDEREVFAGQFGQDAADDLMKVDYAGFRFNGEVLEQNFDAVVEALRRGLPEEVLAKLILPTGFTAVPQAHAKIKDHAKDADAFVKILKALKVTNFIQS